MTTPRPSMHLCLFSGTIDGVYSAISPVFWAGESEGGGAGADVGTAEHGLELEGAAAVHAL